MAVIIRALVALLLVGVARARTEFWLRRPAAAGLRRFFAKHRGCAPNAAEVAALTLPGAAAGELPRGFHARCLSRRVDGGDFGAAQRCVLSWGGEPGGAARYFVARGGNGTMATVARTYGRAAWVVNPVRETYAVSVAAAPPAAGDEEPPWRALPPGDAYAAAAYTTLRGHLLAGEERLAVVKDGGDVVVHILSASRGHGALGTLVFPFVGPMQRRFFKAQLDLVADAATGHR